VIKQKYVRNQLNLNYVEKAVINQDSCIQCGRCVSMCQDLQQMNVLGWVGRGKGRHVGTMLDAELADSRWAAGGGCLVQGALVQRARCRGQVWGRMHACQVGEQGGSGV
jgi:NADH dehydrogenase/NADH:ubiquinone oxidoreductase subunit G